MKHFIPFVLFSFSLLEGKCQDNTKRNFGYDLIDPDWKAQTIQAGVLWETNNGIKGTAFYNEEWYKGYILLSDNHIAKDISLRFNIYKNEIYFLLDSQVLVVSPTMPVAEFGISDQNDSNKITIFRCGYPAINNNTTKTFYNVVVNNKIALLKHYDKRIMEATNSIGAFEKKFIDSESWYIYNSSENKIIQIKKNKNSLLAALPQYANKVQSIIEEKSLKLKTENEWIILFNELNNQIE